MIRQTEEFSEIAYALALISWIVWFLKRKKKDSYSSLPGNPVHPWNYFPLRCFSRGLRGSRLKSPPTPRNTKLFLFVKMHVKYAEK